MKDNYQLDAEVAEKYVECMLRFIEHPSGALREGLIDTPARVVKSWAELYRGYTQDPEKILSRTFNKCGYDEIVLLKNIELYSMCEHHMLPFTGMAHVAYIPGARVVGLSKLARLVDCFARRLQIQERLTCQIADAIVEHLAPKGVAVVIEAKHHCMCSRGVGKQNSAMQTSALRGVFKNKPAARNEFFELIRS